MVVETLDVAKKSAGVIKMARNIFIYSHGIGDAG
jgi:hypothetical protein